MSNDYENVRELNGRSESRDQDWENGFDKFVRSVALENIQLKDRIEELSQDKGHTNGLSNEMSPTRAYLVSLKSIAIQRYRL